MPRRLKIDPPSRRRPRPAHDPPLTRVWNVDDPNSRPRLVRMPPQDAVLYCYMESIGVLGDNVEYYKSHLIDTGAGPMCGSWWAKEEAKG